MNIGHSLMYFLFIPPECLSTGSTGLRTTSREPRADEEKLPTPCFSPADLDSSAEKRTQGADAARRSVLLHHQEPSGDDTLFSPLKPFGGFQVVFFFFLWHFVNSSVWMTLITRRKKGATKMWMFFSYTDLRHKYVDQRRWNLGPFVCHADVQVRWRKHTARV